MARLTLRERGQMTLPETLRRAARLEPGDVMEAEITAEGILLRPRKLVDATQAWFWTPEWQAGEREADSDHAAGRLQLFGSGEEMVDALRQRSRQPGRRSRA